MVFHWRLSDSKCPQVSRTRLSILAVLSNAFVWIVSTRPPTSKSSRPFNNPLVIVPKAPITIGTIITIMFHGFFQFSSKIEVLILLFTFLQIYSAVIIIIIIYSLEFFTSALADGLSLENEWQQVSSSLQDSSQYSGHLQ